VPNRAPQLQLTPGLHHHLRIESHDLERVRSFDDRRLTASQRLLAGAPVYRHPKKFDAI
jgi:hypothetical protein